MEQISLNDIARELVLLRNSVEEMKEIILEDSFEVSDEVIKEIEGSMKKSLDSFISQEDMETEFLDEN